MSYAQRRRFLWILFLIGIGLVAITASATTLAPLQLVDLAHKATAVARMRCLSTQSFWENGEIWTETHFEVLQREKGELAGVVAVRTPGGTVRHLHSHVDEVPVFRAGEEVYLFLWNREGEAYRVLGWSQGSFRIVRDAQSGLETVTQDSSAGAIFDPQARTFRRIGIRRLPVAIFREQLHRALRQENR